MNSQQVPVTGRPSGHILCAIFLGLIAIAAAIAGGGWWFLAIASAIVGLWMWVTAPSRETEIANQIAERIASRRTEPTNTRYKYAVDFGEKEKIELATREMARQFAAEMGKTARAEIYCYESFDWPRLGPVPSRAEVWNPETNNWSSEWPPQANAERGARYRYLLHCGESKTFEFATQDAARQFAEDLSGQAHADICCLEIFDWGGILDLPSKAERWDPEAKDWVTEWPAEAYAEIAIQRAGAAAAKQIDDDETTMAMRAASSDSSGTPSTFGTGPDLHD